MEGTDAAISACVTVERNRASGRELSEKLGKLHADMARDVGDEEFAAWKQFKVFEPFKGGRTLAAKRY